MEVELKGNISYVDYSAKFQIIGTSANTDDPNYNSITFVSGPSNIMKCKYGDTYKLFISNETEGIPYLLTKIDGLQVDEGFVSYSFNSISSSNVTNTDTKTITIIVNNKNDKLVKNLSIGDSLNFNFSIISGTRNGKSRT